MNSFTSRFKNFSWTTRASFFHNSSLWVIVDGGFLAPPVLWRPAYIAYHTCFKFCPNPLSAASNLHPLAIFWCLVSLTEWLNVPHWCVIHLILWIYKWRAWYHCTRTTLLCVSHTCTQRYTAHLETNSLTHPYKNILTPPAICSQQLSLLH